jgi:hypothetical protein
MMKGILFLLLLVGSSATHLFGQHRQVGHFLEKIEGEDLLYFSPLHEFAPKSLLTRCNGESPISFTAEVPNNKDVSKSFQFLVGYSTETSGGNRNFDVYLNDRFLFTITTQPKQKGLERIIWQSNAEVQSSFDCLEYDINGDAFGNWNITVPSKWVNQKAEFKIYGKSQESRDWLMVFQYQPKFQIKCNATSLIYRQSQRRCLQIHANQIDNLPATYRMASLWMDTLITLTPGYNQLSIPSYPTSFHGNDTLSIGLYLGDTEIPLEKIPVTIAPHRHYEMNLIHHSHNDIGYSHHQTEVEKIQTRNIRSAIQWIDKARKEGQQVYWHIESLWAVENFLGVASEIEKIKFNEYVRAGNLVLSANYANILNGLCHSQELPWMLEYAQQLELKVPCEIQNAMITDIPGITYSALKNYVDHEIPFLSLGPNYVEKHADHGDRVGSVIEQTGDTYFYWHPDSTSNKKILVWTAGKGYSYFHNIQDNEKQFQWEKRIAQYVNELTAKNYPLDIVLLRYTKNADNGPVDTTLHEFVRHWNDMYSSPTLTIASVNHLFHRIEEKNTASIPHVYGGEISPYWEDGALSTAREEIQMRKLVRELIELEEQWVNTVRQKSPYIDFYSIHRDVVLFHEHTWGSWCSISDPYSPFTTQQWHYKRSFLTEAQRKLSEISTVINGYSLVQAPYIVQEKHQLPIENIIVNKDNGGIGGVKLSNERLLITQKLPITVPSSTGLSDHSILDDWMAYPSTFFTPVYRRGINPSVNVYPNITVPFQSDSDTLQVIQVHGEMGKDDPFLVMDWEYRLFKNEGRIVLHVKIQKDSTLEKESLHFLISPLKNAQSMTYGASQLRYPQNQLPGSNREFICTDGPIILTYPNFQWKITSQDLPLIEIGAPINEDQNMGAKVWKRDVQSIEQLYLYVFNNYWHTNYKAEQGNGSIEFEIEFEIQSR